VFWGLLYQAVLRRLASRVRGVTAPSPAGRAPLSTAAILGGAAAVTAVAALTDLKLVPSRLTPGFERRLRSRSVFLVYLAFGAGLALAAAATLRKDG
jgi:hypothetical protein